MTDGGAPAIEIQNLTVRFGGRRVIENFSLRVAVGEKVSLVGRSGLGKTTILRCLLGFVAPQAGSIRIEGRELTSASVWDLRSRIAYVPQEPQLGDGRVREALERPFAFRANAEKRDNLERAPELMRRLALDPARLDDDVARLSGGERQRAALVLALLLDRPLLLLDEPYSALDAASRDAVADYFARRADLTALAVSHHGTDGFHDRVVALTEAMETETRSEARAEGGAR